MKCTVNYDNALLVAVHVGNTQNYTILQKYTIFNSLEYPAGDYKFFAVSAIINPY
jgi:hypothetical protein